MPIEKAGSGTGWNFNTKAHTQVHTPICKHAHTRMYMHVCTHADIHIHARTHTHTYTHTCTHMHRQNGQDSGAPMARGKKKDTDNPDTQSNALVQTFFPKKKIELPLDAFYAM